MRVGRVRPDGQFEQVFASSAPLRPTPWPTYRTHDEWQTLMKEGRHDLRKNHSALLLGFLLLSPLPLAGLAWLYTRAFEQSLQQQE